MDMRNAPTTLPATSGANQKGFSDVAFLAIWSSMGCTEGYPCRPDISNTVPLAGTPRNTVLWAVILQSIAVTTAASLGKPSHDPARESGN